MSNVGSILHKTGKPFNLILGEAFECVDNYVFWVDVLLKINFG